MKYNAERYLQPLRQIVSELATASDNLLLDAQKISARYRAHQSVKATDLRAISTPTEALAYAAARMPATFGAVISALTKASEAFPMAPTSILDVGAGPGTASWAACSTLTSIQNVTMLEREPSMQNLGRILLERHPYAPEAMKTARFLCTDVHKMPSIQSDLVVASYSIGELNENDLPRICDQLFTAAKQTLLIIEPGTPQSYKKMMLVRKHLIGKGAFLVAPCPHNEPCLLPQDDWCHFSCRIQRDRLQKQLKGGDAPYEDEKFFYLAFVHAPQDVVSTARILRKPIIKPGNVRLKLCTYGGIQNAIIHGGDKKAFRDARKADIGDSFVID